MKKILVTGGSGFIGSNFIRWLLHNPEFDGVVVNLDALTYAANPLSLLDVEREFPTRYSNVVGDIREQRRLAYVIPARGVDAIIHFAAESHVDRSITGPGAFIDTNIVGTYNLLEVARKSNVRFHHVSTDEVYGSLGAEGAFTEETSYKPNSPYSASKASSDHLVRAYFKTYGLPTTISNCSNNFGPFQYPEKLIPVTILRAVTGKPIPVYGDGKNVRDWIHVDDHCRAIWTILTKGKIGESYNVGGEMEVENIALVTMICEILDAEFGVFPQGDFSHKRLISFVADRLGHDRRYAIDCSKLKALGWHPDSSSFRAKMADTVRWYLNNKEWLAAISS